MQATLLDVGTIAEGTLHRAFTDLCQWRGRYYIAYRQAQTHNIVPKGLIIVKEYDATGYRDTGVLPPTTATAWLQYPDAISHEIADLRDPRFIPTKEALYLMCGAYLPGTHLGHTQLSQYSPHNLIQTFLTYTTDGYTWAPLTQILRPQHWGWSVLQTQGMYLLASYVSGQAHEPNSIVLWKGASLLAMTPIATIYEGGSNECESDEFRYPNASPSEPTLFQADDNILGCLVRTEKTMNIGLTPMDRLDWRWIYCHKEFFPDESGTEYVTSTILHPSAIISTPHGWLMAARRCKPVYRAKSGKKVIKMELDHYAFTTALYTLNGQYPQLLLTLPSGADCAYAGMAKWTQPDEYLISYYDSSAYYQQGQYGPSVPAADIKIARVKISV